MVRDMNHGGLTDQQMGRAANASAAAEIAHGAAEHRSWCGGKQDLVDCAHDSTILKNICALPLIVYINLALCQVMLDKALEISYNIKYRISKIREWRTNERP